jgi:hypothetical protein
MTAVAGQTAGLAAPSPSIWPAACGTVRSIDKATKPNAMAAEVGV